MSDLLSTTELLTLLCAMASDVPRCPIEYVEGLAAVLGVRLLERHDSPVGETTWAVTVHPGDLPSWYGLNAYAPIPFVLEEWQLR